MMRRQMADPPLFEDAHALVIGIPPGLHDAEDIADVFADVPSSEVPRSALEGDGKPVLDLLTESGVAPSRAEAKRQIEGGGVYLNNRRVEEIDRRVRTADAIEGRFLVLRKGKKSYHLVRVLA